MANLTESINKVNSTFGYSPNGAVQITLITYYIIIFVFGLIGNILIVTSVFRYKHLKTVVNIFLANLAIADILFILLSLFDAVQFVLQRWIFGDIICRLQSTSIEVSYTVSVVTLTTVALERYVSICYPYKKKRSVKQSIYTSIMIWIFALLFCSALIWGYHIREDGDIHLCVNDRWSAKSRLIFYIVHSVLVYLLPLLILSTSHYQISKVLELQKKRTQSKASQRSSHSNEVRDTVCNVNSISESDGQSSRLEDTYTGASEAVCKKLPSTMRQRHKSMRSLTRSSNIIRLLIVITSIFWILWTPFIVLRLLQYAGVSYDETFFRLSQLLIFTNTAVNFTVYALMSTTFRRAFKELFTCTSSDSRVWNNVSMSRSFDIAETLRKQFSFAKAAPKDEVNLDSKT